MQYFYEAKNAQGKTTSGAIEAASSQEAPSKLSAAGLHEPHLISGETTGVLRNDLATMTPAQVQDHARREIAFQRTRTKSGQLLLALSQVTKNNAGVLIPAACYFAWGLFSGAPWRIIIGGFGLLFPYAYFAWNWRRVTAYNDLQMAMALGEWKRARKLIAVMRSRPATNDLVAMDLDMREARLDVREGQSFATVRSRVENKWRASVDKIPGTFAGKLLSLSSAARDYEGYLTLAREYLEGQPDAHERRLECAMAEARFGSVDAARGLLDSIDPKLLTPVALRFYDWVGGFVALREGRLDIAIPLLKKTVTAYEEFSRKLPVGLATLALSSAALGLALARSGNKAEGQALLKPVEKPLRVCIDPALEQQLESELDWVASLPA